MLFFININFSLYSKKRKPKTEFRYYRMPDGGLILALLGQKWVQAYGKGVDCLHFHNYLEIGYCYDGQGEMVLGERSVRYGKDQFSIIPKNYPHTTNSAPGTVSKWEYLYIDVEGFLEKFLSKGEGSTKKPDFFKERIYSRAVLKSARDFPEVAAMIRGLLDIMRERKEMYMEEATGVLAALLICIARDNGPGEKEHVDLYRQAVIPISGVLDYITHHYMEPLTVKELAGVCYISETHFRRMFSAYMNMSPLAYLNLVRIQTACDYLRRTEDSVSDIAHKCGFSTLSTFNRNFKQIMGMAPYEWKKCPENVERQLFRYEIHSEQGW